MEVLIPPPPHLAPPIGGLNLPRLSFLVLPGTSVSLVALVRLLQLLPAHWAGVVPVQERRQVIKMNGGDEVMSPLKPSLETLEVRGVQLRSLAAGQQKLAAYLKLPSDHEKRFGKW